ncbi:chemotaxis protein CheW [Photobacterium iliopiscarium]|uniref:chemotaxis protein CheW n=1 Tax=Photobacterium iliopiscarium TaxID=56192 RepID=UPI000D1638C1|nr:chemotaxis protein CheW [Photobacterium iliopiscarium]PST96986.1 chemotaxis protein CheW [Photobacterium iliopiscarium]
MNNKPLTSEQALDDYFGDLLLDAEPQSVSATQPTAFCEPAPIQQLQQLLDQIPSELDVEPQVVAVIDAEPEPEPEPEPEVVTWQHHGQQQSFQALFFEVNGMMFAVALTELGAIYQLGDLNHIVGRPAWYLGFAPLAQQNVDVVDTARWVMADKLINDHYRDNYRYMVILGNSQWGLACDKLHGTQTLMPTDIRWRQQVGKRPWLAGMVKQKMCALIHVDALIQMLNQGLDVNSGAS